MSYFDDALFIGDSLTWGFQEYSSGIPNAKYAAYLGAGPKQFMEGLVENISGQQVAAIDERSWPRRLKRCIFCWAPIPWLRLPMRHS